MENDNIYTYASVNFRNKYGKGFQFDFMILNRDNQEYPFINIYYFPNHSNNHEHYIVNINGKLEVCHTDLKEYFYKKNTSYIIDSYFKNYFGKYIQGELISFTDYSPFKILNNIEPLAYYNVLGMIKKYNYLIRIAVSDYTNSNSNNINIFKLMTIINSFKDNIPKSDRKIKKKSIVKKR